MLKPFNAYPQKLFGTDSQGSYNARNDPKYMNMGRFTLPQQTAPSVADTIRDESIVPGWFKNWQTDNPNSIGGGKDEGFGFNKGSADMVSAGLGGIGNLARGWAAIKGLGIAQDQLDENKRQYNKNFGMQTKAYDAQVGAQNNRTREVNAWKTAQGRTDMRDLIPV